MQERLEEKFGNDSVSDECCRFQWQKFSQWSSQQMFTNAQGLFLISLVVLLTNFTDAELTLNNQKLEWIIGSWRSEFSGKVFFF